MAHDTKWNPHKIEECLKEAQSRAIRFLGQNAAEPLGFLYRLVDASYSYCVDPDREEYSSYSQVEVVAYPIEKKTPKGYWIVGCFHSQGMVTYKRFVLEEVGKKFACAHWEQALTSYVARKKRQASIYQARADNARRLIIEATRYLDGDKFGAPPTPQPMAFRTRSG